MSIFTEDPMLVLDTLVDPVVVIDERLAVTGANQSAGHLFGQATQRLLGRPVLDWVHEPDRVEAAERLSNLLAGQSARPATVRIITNGGELRWVEVTGRVVSVSDKSDHRDETHNLGRDQIYVVLALRNVGWRMNREFEDARALSRAHLLSQLALQFQTVSAGNLSELLTGALRDLATTMGIEVAAVHEVDPDGVSFVLRGRWVAESSPNRTRAIAAAHFELPEVPNWVNALDSPHDVVEFAPGTRLGTELALIDPALEMGITLPLVTDESYHGVLTLGWSDTHTVINEDRDFAVSAAEILSKALERVRSQEALVEQGALFQDLFERTTAAMLMVDTSTLKIFGANPAATKLYGYVRNEMVGMSLGRLSVQSQEDMVKFIKHYRARAAQGVIRADHQRADGSAVGVEVHPSRIRFAGRPLYLFIIHACGSSD